LTNEITSKSRKKPGSEGQAIPSYSWELYSSGQRRIFLFVLFLIGTSNFADRNVIGVLLEPIKAEFGVSDASLGLLSGVSFALFYATLGLPVAHWADRGDRRLIITLALGIWTVMTALCGLAQSFWQLVLVRVGVGAGEAGAVPPAQSLIVDYYSPDRRGRAIGIFMLSSTAGYVLGIVIGGWIAEAHGWRAAFLFVGLPGLVLAILARFVLKEPRHLPQFSVAKRPQESVIRVFRALYLKSTYRRIVYGMVLYYLVAYGALVFSTSFMMRVHGMTVAEAGATFGAISAIGAVIGNLLGGNFADRLAKKDIAWLARLPGWGLLISLPLYEAAFLAPSTWLMGICFFLAGVLLNGVVPPMYTALHAVCGSSSRALAVAIALFFANLIGLGLGPVITGLLSDGLAQTYGPATGLRYALMVVVLMFVPSSFFMFRATRSMPAEVEN